MKSFTLLSGLREWHAGWMITSSGRVGGRAECRKKCGGVHRNEASRGVGIGEGCPLHRRSAGEHFRGGSWDPGAPASNAFWALFLSVTERFRWTENAKQQLQRYAEIVLTVFEVSISGGGWSRNPIKYGPGCGEIWGWRIWWIRVEFGNIRNSVRASKIEVLM